MSQESLENFGAYRLAMELFDLVIEDITLSKTIVSLRRKVSTPTPHALQASPTSSHA